MAPLKGWVYFQIAFVLLHPVSPSEGVDVESVLQPGLSRRLRSSFARNGSQSPHNPESLLADDDANEDVSPMKTSAVPMNLLMSLLLLCVVIVAGSLSIRDFDSQTTRSTRQCPLNPLFATASKRLNDTDSDPLSDAPVDWDKILLSRNFTCVFDPSSLSINSLLATPPPTFRSKVDLVTATANYIKLMNRIGNEYSYVTLSD